MEKFQFTTHEETKYNAGSNFEKDALSELEELARSTGKTVEEIIEHNRRTNPNL